ncbi:MAG TPA: VC0807 family protein [Opitutaceae bacterium]|nr:VC0807 family protein [Opitutaceae bacterium]
MKPPPQRENLLVNLGCNVLLPSIILKWGSKATAVGPRWALVIALAFPVGYFLYDLQARKKFNFISALGFFSILATGTFALMKLDLYWFAVKEAAVPAVIGLVVLASMGTRWPLVREMLYNPQVIDVDRIDAALDERNARPTFEKLLRESSLLLTLSFLVSAVLNYVLARYILKSPAGSDAFNAELAQMNLLSWPVIVVPSTAMTMYALWRLLGGLRRITGLELEQLLHPAPEKK